MSVYASIYPGLLNNIFGSVFSFTYPKLIYFKLEESILYDYSYEKFEGVGEGIEVPYSTIELSSSKLGPITIKSSKKRSPMLP